MRYADDTALLSTTPTGLNKLVKSVKKHSEDKDLLLNAKKTKIMSTDKNSTAQVEMEGEQLENVTNFIYLGAQKESNGKSAPGIRRRLAIASNKLNKMMSIWNSEED